MRVVFFFFKQKTSYEMRISDWSSDVCSSDLAEASRYAIRATNNGISAFIGPRGELLQIVPQFRYATLTMDVMPRQGATPFALAGNWPVITLAQPGRASCRESVWQSV